MNCEVCPFNIKSDNFGKSPFERVPEHLAKVFTCSGKKQERNNSNGQICPAVLWVIVYIGAKDSYSLKHSQEALDELVKYGQSELLCVLFENAPYEIRKEMWHTMATKYPNRMYMFNSLFEREELEPINAETKFSSSLLPLYQHQLFYGKYNPKAMYSYGGNK